MSHFAYRLLPPRPTFPSDMTEGEAATMGEHGAYWQRHLEAGRVLVFGPVVDPAGSWGLAVVVADDEDQALEMARADPAIVSGLCTFQVLAMPGAMTP